MKNIKILSVMFLFSIFVLSCTNNMSTQGQIDLTENIIGNYKGNLKDLNDSYKDYPTDVLIERLSNNTIKMTLHCDIMDTTINFDIYQYMDSLMVCLNGENFENHYGHSKTGKHHMMGDGEMYDWMHHLDEDHEAGEMHYGGFNMDMRSFKYQFTDDKDNVNYVFEGIKQ